MERVKSRLNNDLRTFSAYGKSRGAEKKAKKGQMYSIWGRWIVAMWFDLSPDTS